MGLGGERIGWVGREGERVGGEKAWRADYGREVEGKRVREWVLG